MFKLSTIENLKKEGMMSKGKWDGRFSTAFQMDNFVAEFMEYGRIFRKETIDGFTHDLVDRGIYYSEDYYFPDRERSRGHIHYEFHSDGRVLKNGKQIVSNIGGKDMLNRNEINKNNLDSSILKEEAEIQIEKGIEFQRLGNKFEGDKKKLEDEIEKIQKSFISEADKKRMIEILIKIIKELQDKYKQDIIKLRDEVYKNIQESIEKMEIAQMELEKQSNALRNMTMELDSSDTGEAADAADLKGKEFENMKNDTEDKLREQMEGAEKQDERIKVMRLRK